MDAQFEAPLEESSVVEEAIRDATVVIDELAQNARRSNAEATAAVLS
jgi:hypothetical protein